MEKSSYGSDISRSDGLNFEIMLKKLINATQWGLIFVSVGVVAGFFLSFIFAGVLGRENNLLIPIILGLVSLIFGVSFGLSKTGRKRRRKRRRSRHAPSPTETMANGTIKPFVVKPLAERYHDVSEETPEVPESGPVSLFADQHDSLVQFEEATGANSDQLQLIRVCDVRLDDDGLPLSIHLSADTKAPSGRDVFIVLDHHREAVARVLKSAMKREPGNTLARLFE